MPVPPESTTKQQREARRQEKVAALKKQQARDKRNRRFGIAGGILGGLVVVGLVVTIIAINAIPKADPATISIKGLKDFGKLEQNHVTGAVDYLADYGMNPPAGGNHAQVWLNCGIYSEPVPNENAVHDLEHGAVWITYDPTKISGDSLEALKKETPSTYAVLSPYAGLPAPVVISAWGNQVQLTGPDDARLKTFISKFWKAATTPEPGAPCTGGLDGPGKI